LTFLPSTSQAHGCQCRGQAEYYPW
jgi:hypothetical protein